jgi:hypothetical protein
MDEDSAASPHPKNFIGTQTEPQPKNFIGMKKARQNLMTLQNSSTDKHRFYTGKRMKDQRTQ